MFRIRNPIFQKYKVKEDRYKNGASFIPTPFWKEMVDKWMEGDWRVSINEIHVINSLTLSLSLLFVNIFIETNVLLYEQCM